MALAGGGLYLKGIGDYDDALKAYDNGEVGEAETNARIVELQNNDVIYLVMGGVGLAAIGAGIYGWLSTPERRVALTPWGSGRGVALSLQF